MNEDEYQAHQSVVAAAREKQLQQYRALVLAGQQKQLQELQDATGRSSSGGGGDGRSCSGSGGAAAAKGAGDQRIGVDAAMLTMQQLVALLVEQDVAVANDGIIAEPIAAGASEDGTVNAAEEASRRLQAAHTVKDVLAAAQEHLLLRTLDLAALCREPDRPQGPSSSRLSGSGFTPRNLPSSRTDKSNQGSKAGSRQSSPPVSARGPRSGGGEGMRPLSSPRQNRWAGGAPLLLAAAKTASAAAPSSAAAGAGGKKGGLWHKSTTAAARGLTGSKSLAAAVFAGAGGGGSVATAGAGRGQGITGDACFRASSEKGFNCGATGAVPRLLVKAPRLQAPSTGEVEAVPLPQLPQLLNLSHEPSKVLQARLVRMWGILGWEAPQQMAMVLRYTNRAAVMDFEPALAAWEGAAAAVLQREALLAQLVDLRRLMKAATEASGAKAAADAARAAEEATGVRSQGQQSGSQQREGGKQQQQQDGKQSVKGKNGPSVAIPDVQQLLWAFLVATEQVQICAAEVQRICGEQLAFNGAIYPGPQAVTQDQLQQILTEAWDIWGL